MMTTTIEAGAVAPAAPAVEECTRCGDSGLMMVAPNGPYGPDREPCDCEAGRELAAEIEDYRVWGRY